MSEFEKKKEKEIRNAITQNDKGNVFHNNPQCIEAQYMYMEYNVCIYSTGRM